MASISYSAYVPCYNNAATIRRAVESVIGQTIAPAEVVVIDDGSTDGSLARLAGLRVRMVRHETNRGRGATRARAMEDTKHEFVLGCDATNVLLPDFFERASRFFTDARVAAVYGRITQPPPTTVVGRWRGRHLFKLEIAGSLNRNALLATYGTLVRASAVARVGGYDRELRHTEDAALGAKLLAVGLDVVYDPQLDVVSIATARLGPTLERYWRWHAGPAETVSWRGYWKNIGYACTAMAAADLRARDPGAAAISLLTPHYQFWKSWWRQQRRQGGSP